MGILGFGKDSIFDDDTSMKPTIDKKNTINTKEYCRIKRRMAILKIPYALREQFQNAKKTKAIESPIHKELITLIMYVLKLKTSYIGSNKTSTIFVKVSKEKAMNNVGKKV